MVQIIILAILLQASRIDAYKILVLYPFPSFSHQQPMMVLTEGLVKRGHQVFSVTPNGMSGLGENYTYVDMSFSYKYLSPDNKDKIFNMHRQIGKWEFFTDNLRPLARLPGYQYQSEEFEKFRRQVEKKQLEFDVVIGANIFMPYVCGMSRYLGGKKAPPIISFTTFAIDYIHEYSLGNPFHASYTPSTFDAYNYPMYFWEKMENWFSYLYLTSSTKSLMEQGSRDFFRETYGSEYEALIDNCYSNVSLSMITSNLIYFYPRLLAPNIIELGPLHIAETPQKLPQSLQEWCDGAEKGVIYFSLGGNMRSKNLEPVIQSNFVRVFKELPAGYRVLWKWELEGKVPGQSDNVLTQQWVPQQSLLAHPKIKLFIMQGGLQSYQEAVHYGVPTVGIPWFSDQEASVAHMVNFGLGARLRPQDLYSHEKIKKAIETVLLEESYSKNMKRRSALSRDFTSNSLNKAIFWVEHVARHGGASHLRPSTADSTLFEYFCLDIITTILVLCLTIVLLILSIVKMIRSVLASSPSLKIKKTS
uniref:UDP-glucuronosyltransferase n=1 Tax=Trialeurodes vaporariorum TaxID=88556 RepID=A0A873P521_TRIVP|nr:UDP-gluconosyltransferase [Trialeurodes vaporariorum]